MRRYASTVVVLPVAAGVLFSAFPAATASDEKQHATCWPCHEANVKGNDFVFTRYAR
jgi:cytochrome c553